MGYFMFSKLAAEIISKSHDQFQWHGKLFISISDYNTFIYEEALDVVNNLCWKKDAWVAVAYDNEWYRDVVVEVG